MHHGHAKGWREEGYIHHVGDLSLPPCYSTTSATSASAFDTSDLTVQSVRTMKSSIDLNPNVNKILLHEIKVQGLVNLQKIFSLQTARERLVTGIEIRENHLSGDFSFMQKNYC